MFLEKIAQLDPTLQRESGDKGILCNTSALRLVGMNARAFVVAYSRNGYSVWIVWRKSPRRPVSVTISIYISTGINLR
jgi:hypothetical protein